jgi:hypothetical protein
MPITLTDVDRLSTDLMNVATVAAPMLLVAALLFVRGRKPWLSQSSRQRHAYGSQIVVSYLVSIHVIRSREFVDVDQQQEELRYLIQGASIPG